jgi:branched-chain amino acid transport system permease protein
MTSLVQHIIDAVSAGSLYALFALGVAFIFGVARIVNFAHGELIMVAGYVVLITVGIAWPLVLIAVVAAIVVLSLVMERVVFRPVRQADAVSVLVMAFSLSVFLQNAALAIAGPRAKSVNFLDGLTRPLTIGDIRIPWLDVVTIAVTLLLLAGCALLLRRAPIGRQLRAAAEDFGMARMVGVRANTVIATAFAVSGALAAVGGILLTVQTGSLTPGLGLQPVLIAFIATVIGGMGSLVGAVLGGYLLGAMTVLLQVTLPDSLIPYRDAFVFGVVILALLVRPQGLVPAPAGVERV